MKKEKKIRIKTKREKRKQTLIVLSIILFLIIATGIYYKLEKKDLKEKTETIPIEEKKITIIKEDSNARPIAIMIDNNVGNKNHVGLQEAYITYEIIVEGGLTRIMAIFKDKETQLIGPVRSSRHYFLDYAEEYDAIYAHFGWSTYAEKDIKALGINNINGLYNDTAYWRDQNIAAPHNVFTNIETLYKSAENLGYNISSNNWENFKYSAESIDLTENIRKDITCNKEDTTCNQNPDLITANQIKIPYSSYQIRSYQYDEERKVYLRFMNNEPHIDRETEEQYYYKNIIIEKVNNTTLDSYGRQDLDTTGSGEGYYITNGYALPITWYKNGRKEKTTYTYLDGTELKINDGNTIIQIEPKNQIPIFE